MLGGGPGDGGDFSPLPEGGSDPVGEAVIGYFSLPEERQEQIEESLRVKARAKNLKRAAVREAVESFERREGREPTKEEKKEIGAEVERNATGQLASALKKNKELSERLTNWRRGEGEEYERDQECYEYDRASYEASVLNKIEFDQRGRLYPVLNDLGGLRVNENLREEYAAIPNAYLRRDGMSGDEMADHLASHYPEFGIYSERDLIDFFVETGAA